MATFKVRLLGVWTKKGDFEVLYKPLVKIEEDDGVDLEMDDQVMET